MRDAVRIALWGIGGVYREQINTLLAMQALGQIDLVAAVDSFPPPVTSLDGIPVLTPEELASIDFDFLLLMNKTGSGGMRKAAVELGVPREKVRTYHVLQIPGMDFRSYKRLCETRLSIVANNCWGGHACATLQMESLSPFDNCSFVERDYIRLLEDLDDYLAIDDISFIEPRYYARGNSYLAYRLGDIGLRLTGEDDPDLAREAWLKRKADFNRDNVFVQCATADSQIERRFERLERFPRRVCFVPYDTELPHSMRIPVLRRFGLFAESVDAIARMSGRSIACNLVDLLLGEVDAGRCSFGRS